MALRNSCIETELLSKLSRPNVVRLHRVRVPDVQQMRGLACPTPIGSLSSTKTHTSTHINSNTNANFKARPRVW